MPTAILYDCVCRVVVLWRGPEIAGPLVMGSGEQVWPDLRLQTMVDQNHSTHPAVCRRNERLFSINMQPGSRFVVWLKLAHKRPFASLAFIMSSGYPWE